MSDPEMPPPGVHPAAWTRWQERRGLTPPLPGRPTPAEPARAAAEPAADQIAIGRSKLTALLARLDRLERALRTYGQHALHCAARGGGARCDCGLAAELARPD